MARAGRRGRRRARCGATQASARHTFRALRHGDGHRQGAPPHVGARHHPTEPWLATRSSRSPREGRAAGTLTVMSLPTPREQLRDLITSLAVVHGKVTLASGKEADYYVDPVSYTHLTLPTIYSV